MGLNNIHEPHTVPKIIKNVYIGSIYTKKDLKF